MDYSEVFSGLTLEYLTLHTSIPNVIITAGHTRMISNFGFGLHMTYVGGSDGFLRWDIRVLSPCCYEIYGVSLYRAQSGPMCRGCGKMAAWPVMRMDFTAKETIDHLQAIISTHMDPLRAALVAPPLAAYLQTFISRPPQPTFSQQPLEVLLLGEAPLSGA